MVYNYFFDLEKAAADVEDFVNTLEKIIQLCDIWSERIKTNHSHAGKESSGDDFGHDRIFA